MNEHTHSVTQRVSEGADDTAIQRPKVKLSVMSVRTAERKPSDLESAAAGNNPYGTTHCRRDHRKKPRRTLDDLRKLSEEIKQTHGDNEKRLWAGCPRLPVFIAVRASDGLITAETLFQGGTCVFQSSLAASLPSQCCSCKFPLLEPVVRAQLR
jgi:hypothetical protein